MYLTDHQGERGKGNDCGKVQSEEWRGAKSLRRIRLSGRSRPWKWTLSASTVPVDNRNSARHESPRTGSDWSAVDDRQSRRPYRPRVSRRVSRQNFSHRSEQTLRNSGQVFGERPVNRLKDSCGVQIPACVPSVRWSRGFCATPGKISRAIIDALHSHSQTT